MDRPSAMQSLDTQLQEIVDLRGVEALLSWDQATYMPANGGAVRGRQLAALTRIIHERLTDPQIGHLLDALVGYVDQLPPGHPDAALVRVARRDFEQATRVPAHFMAEAAEHFANSYTTWAVARPANNFAAVRPLLEKTLVLSRQYADFFPGYDHIADPLINQSDFGMTVRTIQPLFEQLRLALVPLVTAIDAQPAPDGRCLRQFFPEAAQWAFCEKLIAQLGYDFARGRQDKTHHPFMIKFGHDDVRITTRVNEQRLDEMLFSTIHECGHALYELGTAPALAGTLLDQGTSAAVHESQSRLWENIVGRSTDFWHYFYPTLQAAFPVQLESVDQETFVRAINQVKRSLIRTDADEVTYNLHVIIRFGLELDLLEGRLTIADLPAAWHARYEENLGVRAPSDMDGVLQDVHWYSGFIGGAFQGYTLGNMLASQFYHAALTAVPTIPERMRRGDFSVLHTWLRDNVYSHGRALDTAALVQQVAGESLRLDPYLTYLHTKYGKLYGLSQTR